MTPAISKENRFQGCLVGLAVGDAVGTTVENRPRGTFTPVEDMTGGGPFQLEPGQWTDDTSMALCLATSLVEREGFDPADQMERYCRWAQSGYLSSTGWCFDIGGTIAEALSRYKKTREPFSGSEAPRSAGNGCIMRLAPVPMFFHQDRDEAIRFCAESSRTTHGTRECLDACRLFGDMLFRALAGASKQDVLFDKGHVKGLSDRIRHLSEGRYRYKSESEITSSGYVVESLEAALWCFLRSESYADAVLGAANLGGDADTTAAVCGQVAGAYYGAPGIPEEWRSRLAMGDEISRLALRLQVLGENRAAP